MIFPLNIRIGNVGLEIFGDKPNSEITPKMNPEFENICIAWDEVKNIVDTKLQEWEYEGDKTSRSFSQNPKMKLMMEIVRALSERGVEEKILIQEILKTGKFSEAETKIFIKLAVEEGSVIMEDGLFRAA